MEKIIQWLSETHGQIRGGPIPNWIFIVIILLFITNYFLYPCFKEKKKKKKEKDKKHGEDMGEADDTDG
jgi:hypothetical protein